MTIATPRVRVLIADDSVTIRKRLRQALEADPAFEVVGEAKTGDEAVAMCADLRPNVVTLDIVMDGGDGVDATRRIMTECPTPILVVSSADNRGEAYTTLSALSEGAVDAIDKQLPRESSATFDVRFRRAVRIVARIAVVTRSRSGRRPPPAPMLPPTNRFGSPPELVAVGASTGGPGALVELLGALPSSFPLPILVVLHIGQSFGVSFAHWLDHFCAMPVREAQHGLAIQPGRIYVCPPDEHLFVSPARMWLNRDPERHSCRPSVDVLFESVAREFGARAIGCLLTGIGRDGAEGLLTMRQAGALTLAQDEASCTVFGMPREAIARGAVEEVGSPTYLAQVVQAAAQRRVRAPRLN